MLEESPADTEGDLPVPPSSDHRTTNTNISDPMLAEIMSLLSKVSEKFEPENLGMKQWIIQNFNDPKIAVLPKDSTLMLLRVLDAIGRMEPVNGITI